MFLKCVERPGTERNTQPEQHLLSSSSISSAIHIWNHKAGNIQTGHLACIYTHSPFSKISVQISSIACLYLISQHLRSRTNYLYLINEDDESLHSQYTLLHTWKSLSNQSSFINKIITILFTFPHTSYLLTLRPFLLRHSLLLSKPVATVWYFNMSFTTPQGLDYFMIRSNTNSFIFKQQCYKLESIIQNNILGSGLTDLI